MAADDLLRRLKKVLDGNAPKEALAAFRGFKAAHSDDQHSLLDAGIDLYLGGLLVVDQPRIVVALIHGIRTNADWQEKAREALAAEKNLEVLPLGYGYLDVIRFLGPWRNGPIATVEYKLRDMQLLHNDSDIVVIAHSFGTYIISKILSQSPDIKIKRLLLCGSIIPIAYRWDLLPHNFNNQNCINEVGTRDVWPIFARVFAFGYGVSGSLGFKTTRVSDRFFDYGHSDFFTEAHFKKFWQPFILSGTIVPSPWDARRPTVPWILSFLGAVPMVKGLLLIALFFIGWLCYSAYLSLLY